MNYSGNIGVGDEYETNKETKCVGDKYEMLVTVLVQHRKDVTDIKILSSTSKNRHQHHDVTIIYI